MAKIKRKDYYKFSIRKIKSHFKGNYTFCNTMQFNDTLWAVYKNHNPDRTKGHKDYLLVNPTSISGRDCSEIGDLRYHSAIQCLTCNEIIYSIHRHDFVTCKCGDCTVDGGFDYFMFGFKTGSRVKELKIDLLDCSILLEVLS